MSVITLLGARGQRSSHVRTRFDPAAVAGIQGWMSTTHGSFLFGDGTTVAANGKDVQQVKDVLTGTTLFGQATLAARPIWDSTSFSVPCVRSNGAQYMERNPAMAAPGLVIATVAFDTSITGNRAISGTRSTATPGGDALEDAWGLRRISTGFLQSLVATSTGVFTTNTPEILGEPIIVMMEAAAGSPVMIWLAGANGFVTPSGTRIAADGEQLLFAKYYNDLVAAIMQGGIFDIAFYSPAPSAADRRRLVDFFQELLWPGVVPPIATNVNAGQIRQNESGIVNVVAPSFGTSLILTSVEEQPSVGTASVGSTSNLVIAVPAGAALGNYNLKYCLRSDVPGQRLVDFGDALFEIIAAAVVETTLPEDQPLPTPLSTSSVSTGTFDGVLGTGGSAPAGRRVTLQAGNYGTRTIGVSGTAANPIQVVFETTRLAPVFNQITVTGQHVIVSGVNVNTTSSVAVRISASNVRFTRSKIAGGGNNFNFSAGVTDILVDHCELTESGSRMAYLANPKDQKRITFSRCWAHHQVINSFTPPVSNQNRSSFAWIWQDENIYREMEHDNVVRLCYTGPGLPPVSNPATETTVIGADHVHQKGSHDCFAFCKFEGGHDTHFRFGFRNRMIGCYNPGGFMNLWDDRHWVFGNFLGDVRVPTGKSAYYDSVSSWISGNNGGFPATTRLRMSGNQADLVTLGRDLSGNGFCGGTLNPGSLPADAQPAGVAKPARAQVTDASRPGGVAGPFAAFPAGDGLSIRHHIGTITTGTGMTCLNPQAVNVNSVPGDPPPSAWLTDLLSEYPWITQICPDPTNLNGGPGNSRPWSIAQNLVRGDLANPSVGYNRNSPGGLP